MKKIISVILSLVIACSVMVVAIIADHIIPGTSDNPDGPMYCNNTYFSVQHSKHIDAGVRGAHLHTDGRTCYISKLTMEHTAKCTSCGQIVDRYVKTCTESHSLCGYYFRDCRK